MVDTEKIRKLLKSSRYTQVEFAERVGLSEQGFIKALRIGDFRISQLSKIAENLNVDITELFIKDKLIQYQSENKKSYIKRRLDSNLQELSQIILMIVESEEDRENGKPEKI
ncbi:MAG: helix-turn-helix transcriptional regulator [Candidatus Omnitrophica bacterium]|nr:helix-turn-helix transcriptional regulator [Candidatus Omnitrophota bacterium]